MARKTKKIERIQKGKEVRRLHYIVEWAERRGVSQADIVRDVKADKGTVSRWFSGVLPSEHYLAPLAEYLGAEDPAGLFRHPDDDWLLRHFHRTSEETQDVVRTVIDRAVSRLR